MNGTVAPPSSISTAALTCHVLTPSSWASWAWIRALRAARIKRRQCGEEGWLCRRGGFRSPIHCAVWAASLASRGSRRRSHRQGSRQWTRRGGCADLPRYPGSPRGTLRIDPLQLHAGWSRESALASSVVPSSFTCTWFTAVGCARGPRRALRWRPGHDRRWSWHQLLARQHVDFVHGGKNLSPVRTVWVRAQSAPSFGRAADSTVRCGAVPRQSPFLISIAFWRNLAGYGLHGS